MDPTFPAPRLRRRPRSVLGAVLTVLTLAVASLAAACTDGGDSCPGGGASGDVAVDGDLWLQPFAGDSVWNRALPAAWDADVAESDPMTSALRQSTITSQDGEAEWFVRTWINYGEFSMPVVTTDWCDPVVTLSDENPDPREAPLEDVRVPEDAEPARGTDRHLLVVQPDGLRAVELFGAEKVDGRTWAVSRAESVDLTGNGEGPDNGVRAYGGSALGGLIRSWEVDPEHPRYVDGVIRHALAVSLPAGMLRYTGGEAGYDDEGFGTALGYVPPATEQDYDSPYSYYGTVPMGAFVALPRSVDLDALGLGPEALAVARALQDYGGYVVDRGGADTVAFYAEVDAPATWVEAAVGPDFTGDQLAEIRRQLVVVAE